MPTDDNPVVVHQGDCLDLLRSLPDGCVDAVITDPPYSEKTHAGHDASAADMPGCGRDNANRKTLGYNPWTPEDVDRCIPELCRVASGWVVVMTDHTLAPSIYAALTACGRYVFAPLPFYSPGSRVRLSGDGPSSWTDWIIVARTTRQHRWGTLPGGYVAEAGWRDRAHMGGKPVKLMSALVRDYSRPGDVVFDPFMGSGSTGVASRRWDRRFIGCELDPTHYATAVKRLDHASGTGKGSLFAATDNRAH
jgi:site-specific DNA-methyltransferase (adenine-specific)